MKSRTLLQLVFITFGVSALIWFSRIPSNYVSANATVTAHSRARAEMKSDIVAEVEFRDMRGFPREEKTRDGILWGKPAIGETITIYYDPSDPSVVRIAAPLNRIGKLYIAGGIMLVVLIWVSSSKTKRNENGA